MEQKRVLVICATTVAFLGVWVFGFVAFWDASEGLRGGNQYYESTELVEYGHLLGDDHLYDQTYSTAKYIYDPSKIMILQVNDAKSDAAYREQCGTVKCWAENQGYQYKYVLFQDSEYCVERLTLRGILKYYYMHLCIMWQVLEDYPLLDYVVRFDGDVVAGANNVSLEKWIDGADVIVQERILTNEIAAGTLMVRNNRNGRSWVQTFLNFYTIEPRGFMGNDNGAIHLALIDFLRLPGRMECHNSYASLNTVHGLPYFEEYLDCCKKLLGPPRRWDRTEVGNRPRATIWPPGGGWMVDWVYLMYLNADKLAPVHHGVKNNRDSGAIARYGDPGTWGQDGNCVDNLKTFDKTAEEAAATWGLRMRTSFYKNVDQISFAERVRKWDPVGTSLEACFDERFEECQPLGPMEESGRWLKFNGINKVGFSPFTEEWGDKEDKFTGFNEYEVPKKLSGFRSS